MSTFLYYCLKFTLFLLQIVEDDSGLGGFGSEIDFTNDRMVLDRVNTQCVQSCL